MFTGLSTKRGRRGFLYSGLPARSVSSMRPGSPPRALRSISPSICGSPSLLRRQNAFQTIKTVCARSATLRAPQRQPDRVEGRPTLRGPPDPRVRDPRHAPRGIFFRIDFWPPALSASVGAGPPNSTATSLHVSKRQTPLNLRTNPSCRADFRAVRATPFSKIPLKLRG
jgi:hypothetical protein